MYKNLYEYIAKNMESATDHFEIMVNDYSHVEPDALHIIVHPENRDGETTDFVLRPDGTEELISIMK